MSIAEFPSWMVSILIIPLILPGDTPDNPKMGFGILFKYSSNKTGEKGFTLVELAIVMVIIGLLIGGILKGQSMIESARIKSIMAQMKGYSAAVNVFQDKYNALPGDIVSATSRIPGCNAGVFCSNGNGDGRIGNPNITDWSFDNQVGDAGLPGVETTLFWKELALADLITGVDPTVNPALPAWGKTHPSCRGCGGVSVLHSAETGAEPAIGNYFAPRKQTSGPGLATVNADGVFSPDEAREIDSKMDDGNPRMGSIRADNSGGNCYNNGTSTYTTPSTTPHCMLIFKMP